MNGTNVCSNPGPGAYNINRSHMENHPKYSMASKQANDPRLKHSFMDVKGPGTYEDGLYHMTKKGKYFVSKFKSTKGYSIPRPSTCGNFWNKSKIYNQLKTNISRKK